MTPEQLLAALQAAKDVKVGSCERDAVFTRDKLTLFRYRPLAASAPIEPLLIVYALVNRPYMLDLQPERSLIRGLLAAGLDVYLIDWGYPDGADRLLTLDDYVGDYLDACVQHVLDAHTLKALNLLGVCQGGTFAACYAALQPERVRNLITMVTPIDFKTPDDLLSKWVQGVDLDAWVGEGNLSGEALNWVFLSLMPFKLTQQKYVDLLQAEPRRAQIEDFVRMERWIFDSPDQAGAAVREFLRWFYQENRLVNGTLELGGRRVELRAVQQPILNLIAKRDHLVPPAASAALQRLCGSRDYTAREFEVGHIGMYVSQRARGAVPALIAEWLGGRTVRPKSATRAPRR